MNFAEWVAYGQDKGWIADDVYQTHDGVPMTEDESKEFDEGGDPCIPVLRVWIEKT